MLDFHQSNKSKPYQAPAQTNRIQIGEKSGIESSPFVHFIVKILFHRSNSVQPATSFEILNDVVVYALLDP